MRFTLQICRKVEWIKLWWFQVVILLSESKNQTNKYPICCHSTMLRTEADETIAAILVEYVENIPRTCTIKTTLNFICFVKKIKLVEELRAKQAGIL